MGSSPRMRGTRGGSVASAALERDHPRVCGEHDITLYGDAGHEGSSPRMRGTRYDYFRRSCSDGIIPAYAGNTNPLCWTPCRKRDHPRVCGEHGQCDVGIPFDSGSSPRMRGTPSVGIDPYGYGGIIPAYAGNTSGVMHPTRRVWDHPRVCGEHRRAYIQRLETQGSSPRMRGTLSLHLHDGQQHGIIPAYAGNTVWVCVEIFPCGDHPRVCGEHDFITRQLASLPGSSPRMRGTHVAWNADAIRWGIIPAYAGNTCGNERAIPRWGDHPRVCGEHSTGASTRLWCGGSSPRMRGTHGASASRTRSAGIIPAYAGNTDWTACSPPSRRDHPRVCGEHWFRPSGDATIQFTPGSSPRMRGTRPRRLRGQSP